MIRHQAIGEAPYPHREAAGAQELDAFATEVVICEYGDPSGDGDGHGEGAQTLAISRGVEPDSPAVSSHA